MKSFVALPNHLMLPVEEMRHFTSRAEPWHPVAPVRSRYRPGEVERK